MQTYHLKPPLLDFYLPTKWHQAASQGRAACQKSQDLSAKMPTLANEAMTGHTASSGLM